jgi:hypothetical protein
MKLAEFCDLDAGEVRVQKIGEVAMVSPNIVRVTYIVGVAGRTEHVAAVHLLWDIADFRNCLGVLEQTSVLIERERLDRNGARTIDATAH